MIAPLAPVIRLGWVVTSPDSGNDVFQHIIPPAYLVVKVILHVWSRISQA